ncbi:MAG TPA: sigma factor-like helix-turn-helix DNA-binding protein [Chloroflexota bacterium]|nr:sigma factor-like helix-turn-helix DNA-binding protein [Chloroflexota bacterium]
MRTGTIPISDDVFLDARSGDSDALAALWDACAPVVKHALRSNPVPPSLAVEPSDVAQEAARLFLETLRGDECTSSAVLVNFMVRKLPDRLNSFLRAERRRLGRQVVTTDSHLDYFLARGRVARPTGGPPGRQVARALECLSPRQRAVIAGLYFRDLDVQALATEIGISAQAVTAVHRRALTTLRATLRSATEPGASATESGADDVDPVT